MGTVLLTHYMEAMSQQNIHAAGGTDRKWKRHNAFFLPPHSQMGSSARRTVRWTCLPLWGRWREAPEEVLSENGPVRARWDPMRQHWARAFGKPLGRGTVCGGGGPPTFRPCAAIRLGRPIPRFAGTSPRACLGPSSLKTAHCAVFRAFAAIATGKLSRSLLPTPYSLKTPYARRRAFPPSGFCLSNRLLILFLSHLPVPSGFPGALIE